MSGVGDHYRPVEGDHDPGVYRVVGTTDGVTLLRVADDSGRRTHTGEVVTVAPATLEAEFEPADDPDAGVSPVAAARNAVEGLYWSVRRLFP
ncbi:MAG: hypothetical protein ABEH77_09540 [Halobacteriaceae archaeon]